MISFRVTLVVLTFLAAVFSSSSQPAEIEPASLKLPLPNGYFAVGTKAFLFADARRNRELMVTTWFPASGGSAGAPYIDERAASELATAWKLHPHFERMVHTNSRLDAAVAQGTFPIVFLEHGSGLVPATYSVLGEGLASNGFIVIAINHPPDSLIAVYPDGHEIKSQPYWPINADRRTQGIAIGKFAENVLVADVRSVLDTLLNFNSRDGFWRGHLDLSRVGIVGHSMGGTTAALATLQESRIRAGINLDGSTFPGMNGDVRPIALHKPLLFIATEEHASDPGTHAREYMGSDANTYYVVVAGGDHMSFSDARLLQSRLSQEVGPDAHAYERALAASELTRSLVEEFMGKYLKGNLAPTLDSVVRIDRK